MWLHLKASKEPSLAKRSSLSKQARASLWQSAPGWRESQDRAEGARSRAAPASLPAAPLPGLSPGGAGGLGAASVGCFSAAGLLTRARTWPKDPTVAPG